MALKVVFIAYDNGHFDNEFPMGIGAIAAVLKKHGHHITIWNQDLHHYPDSSLTEYLDKNKFDVAIMSLIAGYYQYQNILHQSIGLSKGEKIHCYL